MHSSARCIVQVHSPAAAGERCATHWCIGMLQWADRCPHSPHKSAIPVGWSGPPYNNSSLDPHESVPETIGSVVFAQLTHVPNTQTHRHRPCYVQQRNMPRGDVTHPLWTNLNTSQSNNDVDAWSETSSSRSLITAASATDCQPSLIPVADQVPMGHAASKKTGPLTPIALAHNSVWEIHAPMPGNNIWPSLDNQRHTTLDMLIYALFQAPPTLRTG